MRSSARGARSWVGTSSVGGERIDRTTNPLAAMMDESLEELEQEGALGVAQGEGPGVAAPEAAERQERRASGVGLGAPVRRAGRRPGRPRGEELQSEHGADLG